MQVRHQNSHVQAEGSLRPPVLERLLRRTKLLPGRGAECLRRTADGIDLEGEEVWRRDAISVLLLGPCGEAVEGHIPVAGRGEIRRAVAQEAEGNPLVGFFYTAREWRRGRIVLSVEQRLRVDERGEGFGRGCRVGGHDDAHGQHLDPADGQGGAGLDDLKRLDRAELSRERLGHVFAGHLWIAEAVNADFDAAVAAERALAGERELIDEHLGGLGELRALHNVADCRHREGRDDGDDGDDDDEFDERKRTAGGGGGGIHG